MNNTFSLKITQDLDVTPPWEDDDSFKFITNVPRDLGSMNIEGDTRYFSHGDISYEGMLRNIKKHLGKGWSLIPVYAYIHGGIALSMDKKRYPFNDVWDSGMGGILCVRVESKTDNFRVQKYAESIISTLNQYFCGDIYGYVIKDESGVTLDSLWGIYGHEEAEKEGGEALKRLQKQEAVEAPAFANMC